MFGFTLEDATKAPKKASVLSNEIKKFKDRLTHILLNYTTSDNIKWDIFKGLGFKTADDVTNKLPDQKVLDKVYGNIVDQFVTMMKTYRTDEPVRFKFTRQSKAKNYITIPSYAPFMEPMTIPTEQSQLKYTEYETNLRLNNT